MYIMHCNAMHINIFKGFLVDFIFWWTFIYFLPFPPRRRYHHHNNNNTKNNLELSRNCKCLRVKLKFGIKMVLNLEELRDSGEVLGSYGNSVARRCHGGKYLEFHGLKKRAITHFFLVRWLALGREVSFLGIFEDLYFGESFLSSISSWFSVFHHSLGS